MSDNQLENLEKLLVDFVQTPEWSPDAAPPEDNDDWRAGYEAAQSSLREELKPWWPFGGPLALTRSKQTEPVSQAPWFMIERDDQAIHPYVRPMYFCWRHEPGSKHFPRGQHDWTADWQRGARFPTREAAEEHTNNDPLLHVREHAMMQTEPVSTQEHLNADKAPLRAEPVGGEVKAAVNRVGNQFHTTRLTHEVHVDPDDLYLVLKAAGYYPASLKGNQHVG